MWAAAFFGLVGGVLAIGEGFLALLAFALLSTWLVLVCRVFLQVHAIIVHGTQNSDGAPLQEMRSACRALRFQVAGAIIGITSSMIAVFCGMIYRRSFLTWMVE